MQRSDNIFRSFHERETEGDLNSNFACTCSCGECLLCLKCFSDQISHVVSSWMIFSNYDLSAQYNCNFNIHCGFMDDQTFH